MARRNRNTKRVNRWARADRYAKTPRPGAVGGYFWLQDTDGDWQLFSPYNGHTTPQPYQCKNSVIGWLTGRAAYVQPPARFAWIACGAPLQSVYAKSLREAGLFVAGACLMGCATALPSQREVT